MNTALATAVANLAATDPFGGKPFFIPDAQHKALTGHAQNSDTLDAYVGRKHRPQRLSLAFRRWSPVAAIQQLFALGLLESGDDGAGVFLEFDHPERRLAWSRRLLTTC